MTVTEIRTIEKNFTKEKENIAKSMIKVQTEIKELKNWINLSSMAGQNLT